MQDDRNRYRCLSDYTLLEEARRDGVTAEMGVVLAERLSEGALYGTFNTRSN